MKHRKVAISLFAPFAALCLATACSQEVDSGEGPAERAGKAIDQAADRGAAEAQESADAAARAAAEAGDAFARAAGDTAESAHEAAVAAAAAYDEAISESKKDDERE